MNSLTSQITEYDICAQIKLERQTHKGSFLLLEGSNDSKRFKKFLSAEDCSVIICNGRRNVEASIALLQERGLTGSLGLIDHDFDVLLKRVRHNEDISTSRYHDFDVDVFSSDALERYLLEVGDPSSIQQAGGVEAIRKEVMVLIRPLSALRLVNEYFQLGYSLKDINIESSLDDGVIDIDKMIDAVSSGKFSDQKTKINLRKRITSCLEKNIDLWHFSNGHDVFSALSILLQEKIGSRKGNQNHRGEIERVMRLAFDLNDLEAIGLAQKLRNWEQASGHKILR